MFDRDAPCPPCYMLLASRSLLLFFVPIWIFWDWKHLVWLGASPRYSSKQMPPLLLRHLIAVQAVFSTYDIFERGTGLKLNVAKCRGLWLGSWQGPQDSPVAIQWTSGMIKILDIFIGHRDLAEANWMP